MRPVFPWSPLLARALPLACALASFGCAPGADDDAAADPAGTQAPAAAGASLDHPTIARVLLERLALQPGERFLLVGAPGRFDPLVPALRAGATAAGAEDLGAWSVDGPLPDAWRSAFTDSIAERHETRAALLELLRSVDASIMLPGATVTHTAYATIQDVLREGRGRTVHFHWLGAYAIDGSERAIDDHVDATYQRVLADTDYGALAAAQRSFEETMRGARVRVTTPAGTDVSFEIGDRPVTKQDGDASAARAERARNLIDREVELPAGAVRVAPVETTVDGVIAFPPSVWGGERVEGLRLTFAGGRVSDVAATTGVEAVLAEMDAAGPAGRAFREFALGMNPLLAVPVDGERWIPYYGYGAGVVRLSLGDNTELGGAVGGGYVRWNFFVDATVTVGEEVWVGDGRLLR